MEAFLENARIGVPLDKTFLEKIRKEQIVKNFFKTTRNKYENPFTAIAELADNAHDADAKNFSIDFYKPYYGNERLEFLDDGKGMSLDEMLTVITNYPRTRKPAGKIGRYGRGLVCATASIGKVFMMFTKQTKEENEVSYTVLMVSHQFHTDYVLNDTIYAPCLSYNEKFELVKTEDVDTQNLNRYIMEQYGPVPISEVKSMLQKIESPNGTLIVVGNLENGVLDFWNNPHDILRNEFQHKRDKSLREFLKPLYLDAKMKIRLRGADIYPKKVCEYWAARFEIDFLFQKSWEEPAEVVTVHCGIEVENRESDGIHFYFNGRLALFGYKDMKFFKEKSKRSIGFTAYVNLNGEKFQPATNKVGFSIEEDFQKLVRKIDKAMNKYYEYITTFWITYTYFNQQYKDQNGEELIELFWNDIGYPSAFDPHCPREPLSSKAKEWNLKECGVWIVCCKCRQWKRDHLPLDPNFKKEKMHCSQFHYGRSRCHSLVSDHERFDVTLREWKIHQKVLAIKKEKAEKEEEEEEQVEEVVEVQGEEDGEIYIVEDIPNIERSDVMEEEEEMEEEPEELDHELWEEEEPEEEEYDEEIMELTKGRERDDNDNFEIAMKRRRDLEDLDEEFPLR
ncbi:hypothetical protein CAEBREN_14409 [Caenorhabditis brenneri]|uniref:Morc S5 domain-containing protein n=1 Tax=Caenorhabditis brenneri TaxID=135651 RepID=G0P5E6_CAEBE|nr:hypothetical protein CAEBREN_14409 [Caenorhabditis brenneri]